MDVSSALSDDDYDVVSNPSQRSLESSMMGFEHILAQSVHEPPPSRPARDRFAAVSWTAADIQGYVHAALQLASPISDRTKRVYIDGMFDGFNASQALQLRQAKLSFPSLYLIVGIFSDVVLQLHGYKASVSHVERCEIVRHCRWVDEIMAEAPWVLDFQFLDSNKIDYIALEEGISVDPRYDKARLKGYDEMKVLGKVIPIRRIISYSPTTVDTPTCLIQSTPSTDIYGIGY